MIEILQRLMFKRVAVWVTFPNCNQLVRVEGIFWEIKDGVAAFVCTKRLDEPGQEEAKDFISFWVKFIPVHAIVTVEALLRPLYKESVKHIFRCQTRETPSLFTKSDPVCDPIGWHFDLSAPGMEDIDEQLKKMINLEVQIGLGLMKDPEMPVLPVASQVKEV